VNPLRRSRRRFTDDPSSIGNAVRLLIVVTVTAVVAGSIVVWLFDRRDFPDFGAALWFTLQTITTVGYGDLTPTSEVGRIVAAIVMLTAIAFTTVITAAVTSSFVQAAQARRRAAEDAEAAREESALERIEAQLAAVSARLESIEGRLAGSEVTPESGGGVGFRDDEPNGGTR